MDDQIDEQPILDHRRRLTLVARFFSRLHRFNNLLRGKWWILALTIALGLGIQSYLFATAPPLFQSTGRMIVSVRLSLPNGSGGAAYSEELNYFFGTQVALMQGDTVVNRALLRLQSQPTNYHRAPVRLTVTVSPKTSIFNLRAFGGNADYVQAYLQACMDEYIKLKKDMRQQVTDTTKSGILEEVATLKEELLKRKQNLANYEENNSVVFLQDRGSSAANRLSSLTEKLAGLKSDLQLLNMLTLDQNVNYDQNLNVQKLPSAPASPPKGAKNDGKNSNSTPTTEVSSPSDQNNANMVGSSAEADYLKAKQQILIAEEDLVDLRQYLRPKHPKIINLQADIERQKKLLAILRGQTQGQLEDRKFTMERQIKNCEADLAEADAKSLAINKKINDYQVIKDDIQRLQTHLDGLTSTMLTLDVDRQVSQESVTILEPASPSSPAPQEAFQHFGIAGLIGLLVGIGVLFFLDGIDDRPSSFAELEEMFDEQILGQIPLERAKSEKARVPIIQAEDERHGLVEANHNLFSSIVFTATPAKPLKTVILSSAIPGDGKSMTSANLAITMADSGSTVLLVDADLRRGVLHKSFATPGNPGFSEVLGGQIEWSKVVQPTSFPNLFLLPRGDCPRHPRKLFASPTLRTFCQEARANRYDYILFDTPPIMAADDVSNLAPYADGVIMVIRCGYTSGRVARAALDLMHMRNMKILGLVLNAVRPNGVEYYYYKYKNYYGKVRKGE